MNRKKIGIILVILSLLLLLPITTHAAEAATDPANLGILDNLMNQFGEKSATAMMNLMPHALWLALTLGILELTAVWALYDGTARVTDMLAKFMKIFFFIMIIQFWPQITGKYILPSFVHAGVVASGTTDSFAKNTTPSALIDQGFLITNKMWNHALYNIEYNDYDYYDKNTGEVNYEGINSRLRKENIKDKTNGDQKANYEIWKKGKRNWSDALSNFFFYFIEIILGLVIILCFAWIALQVLMAYIEFYITAGLGILLLPFGVNKHTAFLSNKVFGAVINFGVKLMVIIFLSGIIHETIIHFGTLKDPSMKTLMSATLGILMLAVIVSMIPQLVSGMLSGSPSIGAGDVKNSVSSGISKVGAAVGAVGAVVGAGALTAAQTKWATNQLTAEMNPQLALSGKKSNEKKTDNMYGSEGQSNIGTNVDTSTGKAYQGSGETANTFSNFEDSSQGSTDMRAIDTETSYRVNDENSDENETIPINTPSTWQIMKRVGKMKMQSSIANSKAGRYVLSGYKDREDWRNLKRAFASDSLGTPDRTIAEDSN